MKHKKIISFLLALTLVLGFSSNVFARETVGNEKNSGFEQIKVIENEIDEEETKYFLSPKYSENSDPFWEMLSFKWTDVKENTMTPEQAVMYETLYRNLNSYITGGEDFTEFKEGLAFTPGIEVFGVSEDEAKYVSYLMFYNHPELYYLDYMVEITSIKDTDRKVIKFGVYPELAKGEDRALCSANLKEQILKINELINANNVLDKEKQIHDLIIQNVTFEYDSSYNQSIVSSLLRGKSVCAGYAEAFAALCNLNGIPTLCVVSDTHEWNHVYMYGKWFLVDATWDDDDNGKIKYDFFNVSGHIDEYHMPLKEMYDLVGEPECKVFYDEAKSNGDLITIEDIYRLYNSFTGEHFFTANWEEAVYLAFNGWNYEGVAWTSYKVADVPVYRLYNPNTGLHHYTNSHLEETVLEYSGWKYEGVVFCGQSMQGRNIAYRLYNPNNGLHLYTLNYGEKEWLVSLGWNYEGEGWQTL